MPYKVAMAGHENITAHREIKTSSNRSFGLVFAGVFALVATYWWWKSKGWPVPAAVTSAAFLTAALVAPAILAIPNRLWTKFGLALGAVVAPVVMGAVFFLVVTPIGFLARAVGKQFLQLRRKDASTYWIAKEERTTTPERLRDQF